MYELIEAFSELWSEKAKLSWDAVWPLLLDFCEAVAADESFWSSSEHESEFAGTKDWVVGAIARLIEHGCKSDDRAFGEDLMERAESVIGTLLVREKGERFEANSDAVSIAINSARGRCIEAIVNLSLRACRIAHKKTSDHADAWMRFEPIFDRELDRRKQGEYEFATLVANYLPNFLYMSKQWVLTNLHRIFDGEDHQSWLCAMQGDSYVATVYQEIYAHLSRYGHLARALNDTALSERVKKMLIQHICAAYLNGFELMENDKSMIAFVISRARAEELADVIWFFWTLRPEKKAVEQDVTSKLFTLWRRILDNIDLHSPVGQGIASNLCHWLAFVEEVNSDNRELIFSILPYSNIGFRTHDVIEFVARLSSAQPDEAARIWLAVLQDGQSDYPEEAVDDALRNIAKHASDGLRVAKSIADQYLRFGNERPGVQLRRLTQLNT